MQIQGIRQHQRSNADRPGRIRGRRTLDRLRPHTRLHNRPGLHLDNRLAGHDVGEDRAKLKNPLFSESAVGQIGGLLYRNGTYGPIVGRRSITPSLRTPAQAAHRAQLPIAHRAWEALTPQSQHAWNEYATYPATGRNTYIAAYIRLKYLTRPVPNQPTNPTLIGFLENFALTPNAGDPPSASLSWDNTVGSDTDIIFYAYGTYSNRTTPKPSKLLRVGHGNCTDFDATLAIKAKTTVLHLRLELVNPSSGDVATTILLRFTPIWP